MNKSIIPYIIVGVFSIFVIMCITMPQYFIFFFSLLIYIVLIIAMVYVIFKFLDKRVKSRENPILLSQEERIRQLEKKVSELKVSELEKR